MPQLSRSSRITQYLVATRASPRRADQGVGLGDGAYSEVFRVKRLTDQQEYALKKVKMGKLTSKEKENALNEVRILASVK